MTLRQRLELRDLLEPVERICREHHVILQDFEHRERYSEELGRAAQAIWTELVDMGMSYSTIGRLFGRDHTTIIAGVRSCTRRALAKGAA